MKKKFLIILIVLLFAIFIGTKLYTLNSYRLTKKQEKAFKEIADSLVIKDLIVTKEEKLEDNDYLIIDNIKIKKVSGNFNCQKEDKKTLCKEDDDAYLTIEESLSLSEKIKKEKYRKINYKILDEDKIIDDINLLGYIKEISKYSSIFTSNQNIKKAYFLKNITLNNLEKMHSIDLIEGKYSGYSIHKSSKIRIINIKNNNKTYQLTFNNMNNKIEEVLNTLEIE